MDDLDIYDDLDEFHEQEERKSKELLTLEKKYEDALKMIEAMQLEKKDLRKKIRIMEQNLQSLLDTAKLEMKRKDNIIDDLRKEKDDLCFRRRKHWTANNAELIPSTEETSKDSSETANKIEDSTKMHKDALNETQKADEQPLSKLDEKEKYRTDGNHRDSVERNGDVLKNKDAFKQTEEKHREKRREDEKNSQKHSRRRSREKSRERSVSPHYRAKSHINRVQDDPMKLDKHRNDDHSVVRRKSKNDRRDHSRSDDKSDKLDRVCRNPFKSTRSSKDDGEGERKSRRERDEGRRKDKNMKSKRKDHQKSVHVKTKSRKHKKETSCNSEDEIQKELPSSKSFSKNDKHKYPERISYADSLDFEDIESSDDDVDLENDMFLASKCEILAETSGSTKSEGKEECNQQDKSSVPEETKKKCFDFHDGIKNIGDEETRHSMADIEEHRSMEQIKQIVKECFERTSNVEIETKELEPNSTQECTTKSDNDSKLMEIRVEQNVGKSFELSNNQKKSKEHATEISNDFEKHTIYIEMEVPDTLEITETSTIDEIKESKEDKIKIHEVSNVSDNVDLAFNKDDELPKRSTNISSNMQHEDENIKQIEESGAIKNGLAITSREITKNLEEFSTNNHLDDASSCKGNVLLNGFKENHYINSNGISSSPLISAESDKDTVEISTPNSKIFIEKEEISSKTSEAKAIPKLTEEAYRCFDQKTIEENFVNSKVNINSIVNKQRLKTAIENFDSKFSNPKSKQEHRQENDELNNCILNGEIVIDPTAIEIKTDDSNIRIELKKLEEAYDIKDGKLEQNESTGNKLTSSSGLGTLSSSQNDKTENTPSVGHDLPSVYVIDSSEDEISKDHNTVANLNNPSGSNAHDMVNVNKKCSKLNEIAELPLQNDETVMSNRPIERDLNSKTNFVSAKETETIKEQVNENDTTPETIAEEDKLVMETDEDGDPIAQPEVNLEQRSARNENTPSCIIELDDDDDDDDDDNTILSLTLSSDEEEDESLAILKNKFKQQKEKERIEILENIRLPTLFQSNSNGKIKKTPKKRNSVKNINEIDASTEGAIAVSRAVLEDSVIVLSENETLKDDVNNSEPCSSQSKSADLANNSEAQSVIAIKENSSIEDQEGARIKKVAEIHLNEQDTSKANFQKDEHDINPKELMKNISEIVKRNVEAAIEERESLRSLVLAMENDVANVKGKLEERLKTDKLGSSMQSVRAKTSRKDKIKELKADFYKTKKTIKLEKGIRIKSKERRSLTEHNGKPKEGYNKQKQLNSVSELLSENIKETSNLSQRSKSHTKQLKYIHNKTTSTVRRHRELKKKTSVEKKCAPKSVTTATEKSFTKNQSKSDNTDLVKTPVKRKRLLSSPNPLENFITDTDEPTSKAAKLSSSAEVRAMLVDGKSPQTSYNDISGLSPTGFVQDTNIDELDRDMEAIFQSPAKLDVSLPTAGCLPCGNSTALDATINETVNSTKLEPTSDNQNKKRDSSFESKRLSLGHSQYVYERVSENVVNLFITRRRNKKRSNTNTTTPPCNVEQA